MSPTWRERSFSVGDEPMRLHISNIPFRYREPDLRAIFSVRFLMFFAS